MPLITRTNRVSAVSGKPAPKSNAAIGFGLRTGPLLELPTTKSEPINDINRYITFMHGEPGVGKSSMWMQDENAFLLSFDRDEDMAIYQQFCPDWQTFSSYVDALESSSRKGTLPYSRIVVDGVDIAYKLCQAYTENNLNLEDVSDAEWGKGFSQLNKRFSTAMNKLFALTAHGTACGICFISHSTEKEVKLKNGGTKVTVQPYMSAGCSRVILGRAHFAFYYRRTQGQNRVILVRGSTEMFAKCNAEFRFRTPKGEKVFEVPAGNSAEEAWANLLNAFYNKQTFTHVRAAGPPAQAARIGGIKLKGK